MQISMSKNFVGGILMGELFLLMENLISVRMKKTMLLLGLLVWFNSKVLKVLFPQVSKIELYLFQKSSNKNVLRTGLTIYHKKFNFFFKCEWFFKRPSNNSYLLFLILLVVQYTTENTNSAQVLLVCTNSKFKTN